MNHRKVLIDFESSTVRVESEDGATDLPFGSPEAFAEISDAWLRIGWDTKYVYTFSWLGRPIIQLPEDMFRIQEAIFQVGPDVIVETGTAHGGGLVFYASVCKSLGRGRVIGVEVDLRPHNRAALESHPLASLITIVEGSSTDQEVVAQVRSQIADGERVLVVLDSKHTKQHVLDELHTYAPLVTPGSYIVAADGIMEQVAGAPRSEPDWATDNPRVAAEEFVSATDDYVLERPDFAFNESELTEPVTYWPGGWIKRLR